MINARNKSEVLKVLHALSKRIGFRIGEGFCERVIFKELFLSGLTLLDLEHMGTLLKLSHIAARRELRSLVSTIQIPRRVEVATVTELGPSTVSLRANN
jgi:chromosome partitioning protein